LLLATLLCSSRGVALGADVIVAPGQQMARPAAEPAVAPSAGGAAAAPAAPPDYPVRPWELPPIQIEGKARPTLEEEERIGPYGQPRWTANRRFPTTRVYVIPAGMMQFEWWLRYQAPLGALNSERKMRTQFEFEMGLGHRFQLDLYLVLEQEGPEGALLVDQEKIELRYALADWGRLWGNPTLYAEYAHHNAGPDSVELKLLLGDQLAPRWHWGANVVFERQLGGPRSHELALTGGLGYTIYDQLLSMGLEGKVAFVDRTGNRFDFTEKQYLFGPSLLLVAIAPARILFTPLFGAVTENGTTRGALESYLIASWVF
jgi:hypothetical protein